MKNLIGLGLAVSTLGVGCCGYASLNPGPDLLFATGAMMGIYCGGGLLVWGIIIAIHRAF